MPALFLSVPRRLRPVRLVLLLLAALIAPWGSSSVRAAFSEPALQNLLAGYMSHSALRGAAKTCVVVDLSDNHEVFSLYPERPLIPASQMKLLVSATAVELFGPGFVFSATVWSQVSPDSAGRLEGDLYVYGCADPVAGPGIYTALARQVREKGVKVITGDLVGTAPVLLEETDTGLQAARRLHDALGSLGVVVGGKVRAGYCPSAPVLLARHTTVSLADYLSNMNKESRNEEANRLLRSLLACFDDPAAPDSGAAALASAGNGGNGT